MTAGENQKSFDYYEAEYRLYARRAGITLDPRQATNLDLAVLVESVWRTGPRNLFDRRAVIAGLFEVFRVCERLHLTRELGMGKPTGAEETPYRRQVTK